MANSLLLNPLTDKSVAAFIGVPSHALLLYGPKGAGKAAVARHVAANLLSVEAGKLDLNPNFMLVEKPADKKNISIDSVRTLNKSLSLKVASNSPVKRVVLIEDAHNMNQEAQNALLKSLEEPPAGIVFILTTTSRRRLLPTVASRATPIAVQPVSLKAAQNFFSEGSQNVESAWRLSQGSVGLMSALLEGGATELGSAISQAKEFISKSKYDRLLMLDGLSKDKDELGLLLQGLARVIQALYKTYAVDKNDTKGAIRLARSMRLVLDCQTALEQSVLPRLIALRLALNLGL